MVNYYAKRVAEISAKADVVLELILVHVQKIYGHDSKIEIQYFPGNLRKVAVDGIPVAQTRVKISLDGVTLFAGSIDPKINAEILAYCGLHTQPKRV